MTYYNSLLYIFEFPNIILLDINNTIINNKKQNLKILLDKSKPWKNS